MPPRVIAHLVTTEATGYLCRKVKFDGAYEWVLSHEIALAWRFVDVSEAATEIANNWSLGSQMPRYWLVNS